jgi:RimJ/RimL family protein N-acetyltransferase
MEIRRLTSTDADALYRLRLHALHTDPKGFRESEEEMRNVPVATYAERLGTAFDDNFVLGAFDDARRIVGMVGFYREQPLKCRHKGCIWGMFVEQSQRGQGVGRALLSGSIERARNIPGLALIRLTVSTTQAAARKLYASCGFRVTGIEPKAMLVTGEFVDEEQMTLFLV